jgi:hypothetical protein
MEKVYIDGELAYPIWRVSAKWIQDGEQDFKYPKWHEGLPEGRIRNSTDFHRMYKEYPTQEQVEQEAYAWWDKYLDEKLKDKNVSDLVIKVGFVRYETWNIEWYGRFK